MYNTIYLYKINVVNYWFYINKQINILPHLLYRHDHHRKADYKSCRFHSMWQKLKSFFLKQYQHYYRLLLIKFLMPRMCCINQSREHYCGMLKQAIHGQQHGLRLHNVNIHCYHRCQSSDYLCNLKVVKEKNLFMQLYSNVSVYTMLHFHTHQLFFFADSSVDAVQSEV